MRYLYLLVVACLCCIQANAQGYLFTEYRVNQGGDALPEDFAVCNGKLYFSATTFDGIEPWVCDGTVAGTFQLKDIIPGTVSSYASGFTATPNGVLFSANSYPFFGKLWNTDGTTAGTKPIEADYPLIHYDRFVPMNGKFYYGGADTMSHVKNTYGLWETDGTQQGTVKIKSLKGTVGELKVFNGKLYFNSHDSTKGFILFVSDGTSAGTKAVLELPAGSQPLVPKDMIECNGKLFFLAHAGNADYDLWCTDGTTAGTYMVKKMTTGFTSGAIGILRVFKGLLYFTSGIQSNGLENSLWATDGTAAGTRQIRNLRARPANALSHGIDHNSIEYNGKMYFAGDDSGKDHRLWETDGTDAGTKLAEDTFLTRSPYDPRGFTIYNGRLYFKAKEKLTPETHVYVTDGTEWGTMIVEPATSTGLSTDGGGLCVYNGMLFFGMRYNIHGSQLWSAKDTTAPPLLSVANKVAKPSFMVYPNPGNGQFTIRLSSFDAGDKPLLTVCDMTGRQVHMQMLHETITAVSLTYLPKGTYEAILHRRSGNMAAKLMIE